MADEFEEYKQFIASAVPRDLIHQLKSDVKAPLVSAQNLINVMIMMQNPSPAVKRKIDAGELNPAEMLEQMTTLLNQALDVIDFYQDTLDNS
jgi:hypothetical protein